MRNEQKDLQNTVFMTVLLELNSARYRLFNAGDYCRVNTMEHVINVMRVSPVVGDF